LWQAAECLSSSEFDSFSWGHSGDSVVKNFILACVDTLKSYLQYGNDSQPLREMVKS